MKRKKKPLTNKRIILGNIIGTVVGFFAYLTIYYFMSGAPFFNKGAIWSGAGAMIGASIVLAYFSFKEKRKQQKI